MSPTSPRIAWVDYAKGLCIVLVVLMHSTLGVEKAAGSLSWLHGFIEWARPFRMPDFFLISGLFLSARIDRPWRSYLDSKLIHFGYFYLLWMTLQVLMRSYGLAQEAGLRGVLEAWALGLVEPFGTLWFIYMLAVFFIAVKVLRHASPVLVVIAAAFLQMSHIETGWLVIDEFAARFVYFYAGYSLARLVFAYAESISARKTWGVLAGLAVWASVNTLAVEAGVAQLPGIGLALGLIGAAAVIAAAVLLAKTRLAAPLRYCGRNSIVIYLAFFIFMAAARILLLRLMVIDDLGLVALVTTAAGVTGPLLLFWAIRGTALAFLFRRPQWARPGRGTTAAPSRFDLRRAAAVRR